LFSERHYVTSKRRINRQAFTPKDGQCSVFRTLGLAEDSIWTIGRENVGVSRNQTLKARADLPALSVREATLDVLAEPSVHPRHANIVGFPDEKEKQRLATMELAMAATLIVAP